MFEGLYLHISTPSYRCVYAEFTCMCVCIDIHVRHIQMCVCIYLHICTRAYKCMHTCLCLYMCVWVYIYVCIYVCERTRGYIQMQCVCNLHVCLCMWHVRTLDYMCVSILTYIHAHWFIYVAERTRGYIQMQCVCMQIYVHISGFVRVSVCVYIYTCMYGKTPCVHAECVHTNTEIHVCVCILFTGVF